MKLLVALGADHKVKNKVGRYPYQVVHDSEDMRKLKRTIIERPPPKKWRQSSQAQVQGDARAPVQAVQGHLQLY